MEDEDTEHAQWAQLECEQQRREEDALLRRCKRLTDDKKLTDEKFNTDFTRSMRTIMKGDETWR
jgi:hypothetical protein